MTIQEAIPREQAPAAKDLPDATGNTKTISSPRPASPCADQPKRDTQRSHVGATNCDRHVVCDAHDDTAVAQLNGGQISTVAHGGDASVELLFCSAFLDDVEQLRIATGNRIAAFEREGFDPGPYRPQLEALLTIEHDATLALQRAIRRHPLGAWIKRTIGIGEKQGARLIAAIGDVAYNHAEGRPRRGPDELRAYCGFRPGQRRQKGVKSNWNAAAKMRARLVAESCIKQSRSPYRAVYDQARAAWADRDTTDMHKHNHALRVVAKAILRDLFLEARKVGA